MQLTDNFNLSEFASHDGTPVPKNLLGNAKELAEQLQVLRHHLKKPILINSAYRSPKHNKNVGGSPNSQHLKAKAADIRVPGVSPLELFQTIEKLIQKGKMKQGGLGLYKTFVHYDTRGKKARWDFSSLGKKIASTVENNQGIASVLVIATIIGIFWVCKLF